MNIDIKKRIGIITNAVALIGEKGYSRFEFLARYLTKNNFEVDLITSSFQHWEKKQRDKEKIKKQKTSYNIILLDEPGYKKNVDFRRIISHGIFAKNLKKYLNEKKRYDLLYCIIPDNYTAATVAKYANKNNIKLIIDTEDLWPEAMQMVINIPILSQVLFYPFIKNAKIAYNFANGIIGTSDEYTNHYKKYINKILPSETVYVGNELEVFDSGVRKYKIEKKQEEYWITYAGNIGTSYDIKTLILAGKKLKDKGYRNIKIKILGIGPLFEELKNFSKDIENIEFLGYIEYPKMAAYLSKSDIVINSFVKKAPQSIVTKIGDYLASGKPMINTCSSIEFKTKVEKDNFGISIEAENVEELEKAILKLYENKELAQNLGKNARKIAEEEFNREKSYYKIVEMINSLLGENNEGI